MAMHRGRAALAGRIELGPDEGRARKGLYGERSGARLIGELAKNLPLLAPAPAIISDSRRLVIDEAEADIARAEAWVAALPRGRAITLAIVGRA